jgi:hypothetical protein
MYFSTAAGPGDLWKSGFESRPSIWFASTDVQSDKLFQTTGTPLL